MAGKLSCERRTLEGRGCSDIQARVRAGLGGTNQHNLRSGSQRALVSVTEEHRSGYPRTLARTSLKDRPVAS